MLARSQIVPVLIILFSAPVSAQTMEDAARSAAKELGSLSAREKKKVKSVALSDFAEAGPAARGLGAPVAEAWGKAFEAATGVSVLDRAKTMALLQEANLAEAKPKKQKKLEKLLHAQAMLMGEVQDLGDKLVVNARLVAVSSGKVLTSSKQSFSAPALEQSKPPAVTVAPPAPAIESPPPAQVPPVPETPSAEPAKAEAPKVEPTPVRRAGGIESGSVEVAIRKLADKLADGFAKLPGNARYRRLAVLPFEEMGEETKRRQIGAIITAEVATVLRRDHALLLVERAQLADVLGELKLQSALAEDPEQANNLGKLADAQALVIGSVSEAGDRYLVNARLVATETGQTLAAESEPIPAAGMVALASDAVVLRSRSGAVFRSVLIPGWGQFYNRQAWKGWLFMGGEVALLGSALAFHLAGNSAYNDYTGRTSAEDLGADPSKEAERLYETASNRYTTRNIILIAAASVWVLNVFDAYASGVDGEQVLSGGVAANEPRFTPLAALGPSGGEVGFSLRW